MTVASSLQDLAPNATLGHYTIFEHVAEGGMGHVYRGFEASLSREVAIKVLKAEYAQSPEKLKAFDAEAQNIAALRHPNIVPIYFVGHQGDLHYFVMPFISGSTLDEWIDKEVRMPADYATWVLDQAIEALDWAYRHNVVHLDIKPSNFLIDKGGMILLTDFGVARSLGLHADTDECYGTPAYMCPEQISQQPTDQRSDIYSLGATIYHLMTGQFLHDGESVNEMVRAHLEQPFPMDAAVHAGLSPGWIALIEKMTRREPEDRFQDYAQLREALQHVDTLSLHREADAAHSTKVRVPIRGSNISTEYIYGMLNGSCAAWTAGVSMGPDTRKVKTDILLAMENPDRPLALHALAGPLKEIASATEGDVGDMAEALQMLPQMDEFVLQLAASPLCPAGADGQNRRKAVRAVGSQLSAQLVLTGMMLQNNLQRRGDFNWTSFWQHNLSTAITTKLLLDVVCGDFIPGQGWVNEGNKRTLTTFMRHSTLRARSQAFFAGLTHDIGKLMLAEISPYTYYCALRSGIEEAAVLAEQEEKFFGMSHGEAGERWLQKHGFDSTVRQVAASHDRLDRKNGLVVSAVALANAMVNIYGLGFSGNSVVESTDLWHTEAWAELYASMKNPEMNAVVMEKHFLPLLGHIPQIAL
ncbi:MAG: protein kinase [Verrucomicrobiales bacterium]|jgi:serine/threonine protein kinase/HD-like signal output (HDOD) protein|nr:protein kinase [Verrucomicrobiales bacterium]